MATTVGDGGSRASLKAATRLSAGGGSPVEDPLRGGQVVEHGADVGTLGGTQVGDLDVRGPPHPRPSTGGMICSRFVAQHDGAALGVVAVEGDCHRFLHAVHHGEPGPR
ncbi:hypothetical protein [Actinoplanes nipponensis]|uniref:hypothetical protein n=1 Tax=Actinoplanes nipponensis TaxID=135950 RepID=UPI0031F12CFC